MNDKRKFSGATSLLQLILVIAVIALVSLTALPVRAEVGTINLGVTNFFKAQTGYFGAQYCTNVVPCDNVDTFDLVLEGGGSAAGTDNITLSFAPCVDSSRTLLATNTTWSWVFAAPGAANFRIRTNVPNWVVGSAGGFAVIQVTNAAANCNLTNVSLRAVKKVGRR